MNQKGVLIVLSGFSGSGKGTVVKELLNRYSHYDISVSATSRGMRAGEVEGREYYFKTNEAFKSMIEANELIEWTEYVGNYYGTPKQYVYEQMEKGDNVILEIEMNGALQVRQVVPDALLIFIAPPDALELEKRLNKRGTEDAATIRKRLERAHEEVGFIKQYDYFVVNDDLDQCVTDIHHIIESEKKKITRQPYLESKYGTELEQLLKGEH